MIIQAALGAQMSGTTSPYEDLLIKMWSSLVDNGIGRLLSPWQKRREALAQQEIRRAEMLAIAQAEHDAAEIRAGRKLLAPNGCLLQAPKPEGVAPSASLDVAADLLALPQVLATAGQESALKEADKQFNLAHIVRMAEEEARRKADAKVSEKVVDKDWLTRWREGAESIANDDMRFIWAQILVAEFAEPGSFSGRTLNFLRHVTRDEAKIIERLFPLVFDSGVIFNNSALLNARGLEFSDLLTLEEMGILSGVQVAGLSGLTFSMGSHLPNTYRAAMFLGTQALVLTGDDGATMLKLPVIKATQLCRELRTLSEPIFDLDYLESVARHFKTQGVKAEIGTIASQDQGGATIVDRREVA
jgi:hypothetical protein